MVNRILVCVFFLFIIGAVSAAEFNIDFLRDSYGGRDSVQVMILNNLTLINDIGLSNIKLYDEDKIPLSLNLYKIEGGYFVFFDLPGLVNGSYNFVIEDLSYTEDNVLKKESFSKDLVVDDLNYSLGVYPMFVDLSLDYWEKPRLNFKLKNYFNDVNVTITGNEFIKPRLNDIKLKTNEEYDLIVDINQDAINGFDAKGDLVVDYGYVYKIPIYVHKKLKGKLIENKTIVKEPVVIIKEGLKFIADADMVNRTINQSTSLEGSLRFKNFAGATLHGLKFNFTNDLDEIVRLEYNDLDFIDKDDEKYVILFVNEKKDIDKNYEGKLVISTNEGVMAEFSVYIYYKGFVEEEKIEVEENLTFDYGFDVQKVEEESNLGLYIVIIVSLGILIVIISYFYKKSKPQKKKFKDLLIR